MEKRLIGLDLCDTYTQVCCAGAGEVRSYPTVVCRRKDGDAWLIGQEAYACALEGDGVIVDKLLKLLRREGTATIGGVRYEGIDLMQKFLERVLAEAVREADRAEAGDAADAVKAAGGTEAAKAAGEGQAAKGAKAFGEGHAAKATKAAREGQTAKAAEASGEGQDAKVAKASGKGQDVKVAETSGKRHVAEVARTSGEVQTAKVANASGEGQTAGQEKADREAKDRGNAGTETAGETGASAGVPVSGVSAVRGGTGVRAGGNAGTETTGKLKAGGDVSGNGGTGAPDGNGRREDADRVAFVERSPAAGRAEASGAARIVKVAGISGPEDECQAASAGAPVPGVSAVRVGTGVRAAGNAGTETASEAKTGGNAGTETAEEAKAAEDVFVRVGTGVRVAGDASGRDGTGAPDGTGGPEYPAPTPAVYDSARIARLVITVPKISAGLMDMLVYCADRLKIPRDRIRIISHTESFLYYVLSQKREVWNNQVGMFDLSDDFLCYYEMKVQRGMRKVTVVADREELDEGFNLDILNTPSGVKLADKILCSCGERFLQKKLFSSIFLTGKGFETQDWAADFMKLVCTRRRVYVDTALFVQGAAYKAADMEQEKTSYPYVLICDGRLDTTVSLKVLHRDQEEQLVLAAAGDNWYEAKTTLEFILDNQQYLEFVISPADPKRRKTVKLTLEGFPERNDKSLRIQLQMSFLDERTMAVTVKDLGFGEFYPSSGAVIRQEVML